MADTLGPAILGLPTFERLKVIILNCAVRITHESPKLLDRKSHNLIGHDGSFTQQKEWGNNSDTKIPGIDVTPGMVRHVGTFPNPVDHTPKSRHILSKEQLIKDCLDCFKGIERFPGTYKIHLKKDTKPEIHPQQMWPITL